MSHQDPSRGTFRIKRRKSQPIMHLDKTEQDSMPVNERPRVQAAAARRKAMSRNVDAD
jgi:hypothetical protein